MIKSFLLLSAFCTTAFGTVLVDSNIVLVPGGGFFGQYRLTISQDAGGSDWTSIWFDRSGGDLIFRNYNVDEGSDWYFAEVGDVFDTSTISLGSFVPFSQIDQSYGVGISRSFYLGVNTGLGFGDSWRSVFGWVELYNNGSEVELLRSAVTYDTAGIVIGTTTTVPEPGVFPVVAAGFLLVPRRRR